MSKLWIAILGVILLVVGAVGIAITVAYQPSNRGVVGGFPGRGTGMGTQSPQDSYAIDAMFIEQMIPHHEDAVEMADLALDRAEHPELKELAEEIKRAQTAEIEQMREWYREWFDAEVPEYSGRGPGMMGGGMMGRAGTDMEALEDADAFDREFIEQMIPHHQMALMMSGMLEQGTDRPEMSAFAQEIIDTQSREIEQMQEWYGEWYDR